MDLAHKTPVALGLASTRFAGPWSEFTDSRRRVT